MIFCFFQISRRHRSGCKPFPKWVSVRDITINPEVRILRFAKNCVHYVLLLKYIRMWNLILSIKIFLHPPPCIPIPSSRSKKARIISSAIRTNMHALCYVFKAGALGLPDNTQRLRVSCGNRTISSRSIFCSFHDLRIHLSY